jgi:hypothetical protein
MILPAYKAALGGQLKNRPGHARASASLSPGFHPGSAHTIDAPITQYEISNHKSEIHFPALEFTLNVSSLAFLSGATPISPATCGRGHISHHFHFDTEGSPVENWTFRFDTCPEHIEFTLSVIEGKGDKLLSLP